MGATSLDTKVGSAIMDACILTGGSSLRSGGVTGVCGNVSVNTSSHVTKETTLEHQKCDSQVLDSCTDSRFLVRPCIRQINAAGCRVIPSDLSRPCKVRLQRRSPGTPDDDISNDITTVIRDQCNCPNWNKPMGRDEM